MWAQHCFSIPCRQVGQWHSSIRSQFCNALLGAEEWQATSHLGRSSELRFQLLDVHVHVCWEEEHGSIWQLYMPYLWWNSQSLNDIDWYFWNWLKLVLEGQNEKSGTKIYIQEVGGVLQCQVYCLLNLLSNCCQLTQYITQQKIQEKTLSMVKV